MGAAILPPLANDGQWWVCDNEAAVNHAKQPPHVKCHNIDMMKQVRQENGDNEAAENHAKQPPYVNCRNTAMRK